MKIKKFTFNPFAENTYIVSDGADAAIIDPGMMDGEEEKAVVNYLEKENLSLKHLLNTHCHIDHILGNQFIAERFQLKLFSSEKEQLTLSYAAKSAELWNIPFAGSPPIEEFLKEGDQITIGNSRWDIYEVPGHSVGHIIFFNKKEKVLIGGDTLFQGSIGRTDLPGGNHNQLITNIKSKMMTLDDEVLVYSGHGPETTIGFERENNYFLN